MMQAGTHELIDKDQMIIVDLTNCPNLTYLSGTPQMNGVHQTSQIVQT